MKLKIKKYLSIFVCVAFLVSLVNINMNIVKTQPATIIHAITLSGDIFEDIGSDTYKNGLLADSDSDDWDPWNNPTGTEDNGAFDAPQEGLVGVKVYLDDNPTPIATTGAGGAWSTPAISTFYGKHYLTFKKDGYVTKTRNIDIYSGTIDVNATFLERADAVIGRVTDTDGNPIAGARVIAYPRGTTSPWALTSAVPDAFSTGAGDTDHIIEAFTDKFGNYVLKGLEQGNYEIRVTKEEYSPQFKTIYGINTALGPKTLDFTLSLNPGTLEGYVKDMSGNPIPNAIVAIPGLNLSTTTDSSGYYKIEQIPAGMYTIVAKAQGYETEVYYYDDANNPAGGDPSGNPNPPNSLPPVYAPYIHAGATETLNFQMDVASQECANDISGIVSNGAPIEYAEVEIPGLGLEITTDKTGFYIFTHVPCGTYWVVASDPEPDSTGLLDHKSKKALVTCSVGQDITQDFVLDENPCTIFGRVLQYDSDWVPVANATVEIPNAGISTTTDSFGYYVIENLPVKRWSYDHDDDPSTPLQYHTKEYLIKVSKDGYFSTTEYVKPIPQSNVWQEFHIKKKTGILKGKVTEWDTDQGIKDIKVTCAGRETYTDSNGFYEFVEVPIGSYTVHAEDYTWDNPGGFPNYDNKAKINQVVTYGNVTIVDFRLPDNVSGKITGSVSGYIWYDWNASGGFSNEGEGVKDAEVTVSGKHTVFTDSYGYYVSISDTQDMYGQYDTLVIKAGPPGHVVTVDASGYFIAHSNVQTTADMDITDLSLGIPPAPLNIQVNKLTGDLKGTVYDKDKNKPLPLHIVTVPLAGAPPGYVPFYDGVPTSYPPPLGVSAWGWSSTDVLGTYLITNIPKGDHIVWEYAPPSMPNYHDMFERVDIQSLINKNFGATRKTGRIEGFVWDDGSTTPPNNTFDPSETSLFNAVVKLSGKSTDPTSNDDNYSSIADSTGYYTILNVRITEDWDVYWNRYTGTAEYSGYYKEKWEHPGPPTPRWRFDNNIEVWWADRRANETTLSPEPDNFYDFPMYKKDGGPHAGGPDGLISGYVDLYLSLYSSNAEIVVQATNFNVVSDIEGYYLIWNHGVHITEPLTPPDWGTEWTGSSPPWGIPAGNYTLHARALWYEKDVLGLLTETYDPMIYPDTVSVHSETANINFDLSRKSGGLKGSVEEDKTPTGLANLYLKDATVTIGNPDNGIGLPYWQKTTVDGGEYEFNDQQNGVLPVNQLIPGAFYMLWFQKDSCNTKKVTTPVTWNVVTPLVPITLDRWIGFIDGFVLDCDTNKPIVGADVNATKQRTNPNPSATNEIATYNYDATENPPINNTDLEGYYLVECSVSTPKVHPDETEYTVTAAKTNYPTKSLNNITVQFNQIAKNNNFTLCKELGNTGVILGIVYVDGDTDDTYDPGEEIGGVTVEIPGLDKTTISTTDIYSYDPDGPGGNPPIGNYNFIFSDVPLLPDGNMARYWLKFTEPTHEMAYAIFETVTPTAGTYTPSNYTNNGTEDNIMDDSGNYVPLCGLAYSSFGNGWIEGLVYAPGSPNERLTSRDDNAKVWIPGAYRQCPTDDVGYYIIGRLAPYIPVGSTYPAVHTMVATADGYKPKPERNVGLNSDTPWNHTWQDFSMEIQSSMDYGILQGVVYFDGGIAVGDVGDKSGGDPTYDTDVCNAVGDYDGPDPANPFEPDGEYDVLGTGEDTQTEGIRNATVTLNPTTTTDSYGYYILTDIPAEMSHQVSVSADLFQTAQHNVFIDSGWNTENFAMDAETGSISGRVYEDFDQDGAYDPPNEAIENATVRAWLTGTGTPSFAVSVYTQSDGMYLMPLVPIPVTTGSYTVHAEQLSGTPRYEPNEVDNVHVDPGVTTTGVDITLMREHGDVHGTVTYDGIHPLYGAKVEFFFHWYSDYVKIYEAYTNSSGHYMFSTEDTVVVNNELDPGEDLPGGRPGKLDELWEGHWTIQVSHPAFDPATKDIVVASSYTVDFDLSGKLKSQTAVIQGYVKDDSSTPIQDVEVTADRGDIQVQAKTDGTGFYKMFVPYGQYNTITAEKTALPTATQGPFNIMNYGGNPPPGFSDIDSDGEVDDLTLNFTIANVVVLISPKDGLPVNTSTPTLDWYDFSGATSYRVQLSLTSDCSSPLVDTTVTVSQYTPSALTDGNTYYWRVNANNDPSTWSDIWEFTVEIGTSPTLLSPPNNGYASTTTPTFLWTTAPAATGDYEIQVSTTNAFNPGDIVFDHTTSNTWYTTQVGEALIDGHTYYWRVRRGTYSWSDTWHFTVNISTASISGTVTSGGSSLEGATVVAYYYDSNKKIYEACKTSTVTNGYYELSGLDPSYTYDIACYMEDYKADAILNVSVSAGTPTTNVDFDLEHGTHYDINLHAGWNLISLPLIIDENVPIPAILNSIDGNYEELASWDAVTQNFEYYYVDPASVPTVNDFVRLKQFNGYWIKVTSSTVLRVSGIADNSQKTIHLKKGWNLIGYVFTVTKNSVTAMTPLSKIAYGWRLQTVPSFQWYFLDPNNNYPWYTDNPKDNTLIPGYGYWIYATEDFTLTIQ